MKKKLTKKAAAPKKKTGKARGMTKRRVTAAAPKRPAPRRARPAGEANAAQEALAISIAELVAVAEALRELVNEMRDVLSRAAQEERGEVEALIISEGEEEE